MARGLKIDYSLWIGTTSGRLTARKVETRERQGIKITKYKVLICDCECGNTNIEIDAKRFRDKEILHCGCISKRAELAEIISPETRIKTIFKAMHNRCFNETNNRFKNYEKIENQKICDAWNLNKTSNAFESFYNWAMQNGYSNNLSIDREKVNLGYSPENCRFTDSHTQGANIFQDRSNSPSGYKGVFKASNSPNWRSRIQVNGKQIHLGTYTTKREAAEASIVTEFSNSVFIFPIKLNLCLSLSLLNIPVIIVFNNNISCSVVLNLKPFCNF